MVRIAFTANDALGLDGMVCEHFGHSPYFVFVDLDDNGNLLNVQTMANPMVENHSCGAVVSVVSQQKANVMISGGMGMGALMHFQAAGIDVFTGASGSIRDALSAYQAGSLPGNQANCQGHAGGCHS
jgi:predicted Fe-Mo cluster-binding NifX family protein